MILVKNLLRIPGCVISCHSFDMIIKYRPYGKGSKDQLWVMGPLGSGPRCGTEGLGQKKPPGMPGIHLRAVRKCTKRALVASYILD